MSKTINELSDEFKAWADKNGYDEIYRPSLERAYRSGKQSATNPNLTPLMRQIEARLTEAESLLAQSRKYIVGVVACCDCETCQQVKSLVSKIEAFEKAKNENERTNNTK